MKHPVIIQGGMGVAISSWRLASAVSQTGNLGVVSGTGIAVVLARRLNNGDPGGHMRRALEHFPVPAMAERIYKRYYREGGRPEDAPYTSVSIASPTPSVAYQELTVVANFVEVWLAREGHDGLVGINLMEKLQFPNVHSLYGAMLAGTDYVLMGAGIPREIPGVLDLLADHNPAYLRLSVDGAAPGNDHRVGFDPRALMGIELPPLKRPQFLAIIASNALATTLVRKSTGRVNGFIIEDHTAGGHNAPPRGAMQLNEHGEPLWGPRDEVELDKIRELELPFWLAGSRASPEGLRAAQAEGAVGIQAGTMFALSEESGLDPEAKRAAIELVLCGQAEVYTDPLASPTSFPFKVLQLPGTASEPTMYAARPRLCDLGYLRQSYELPDGSLGFRCPAEPVEEYLAKGGALEDTVGRKCLCNGLFANAGLGQHRRTGYDELPLVTIGEDIPRIARFVSREKPTYTAREVIDYLEGR